MSNNELSDAMKELAEKLREEEKKEQEAAQTAKTSGEQEEPSTESVVSEAEATKESSAETGDEEKCYWEKDEPAKETKKTRKWVLPAILGAIAVALGGTYFGGVAYYNSHFLPKTTINGISCDNMKLEELYGMLNSRSDYSFTVQGRNPETEESGSTLGTLDAQDIGLEYTYSMDQVKNILQEQKKWNWVAAKFGDTGCDYSVEHTMSFDPDKAQAKLFTLDAFQEENMRAPQDAYIGGYSAETKHYEIVAETRGSQMDTEKAAAYVLEAIGREEAGADVEQAEVYSTAKVLNTESKMVKIVDTINHRLDTKITYDWHGYEVVVDADLLTEWMTIDLKYGEITLDEDAVAAFVQEQADKFDSYGTTRIFKTSLGAEVEIVAKKYGWQTDVEAEVPELIALIESCAVVDREPVYSVTAMQKGQDDIGNSYVECDLSNQHLYLYMNGELVKESDFVSGTLSSTKDCVTPSGIFGLTYKKKGAVLRGADYATKVNYWMPFYNNYGLHDATWRKAFGGEIYKRNGSHGCVNLPYSTAQTLFENVDTGFPVITYYYENGKNPAKDLVVEESSSTKASESIPVMQETEVPESSTPAESSQSQPQTQPSSQPAASTPAASITPVESSSESSAPAESIPESSTPSESIPESSAPTESSSESSTPSESIPESSAPAESIPESSEPAPSEQTPNESVPPADGGNGAE